MKPETTSKRKREGEREREKENNIKYLWWCKKFFSGFLSFGRAYAVTFTRFAFQNETHKDFRWKICLWSRHGPKFCQAKNLFFFFYLRLCLRITTRFCAHASGSGEFERYVYASSDLIYFSFQVLCCTQHTRRHETTNHPLLRTKSISLFNNTRSSNQTPTNTHSQQFVLLCSFNRCRRQRCRLFIHFCYNFSSSSLLDMFNDCSSKIAHETQLHGSWAWQRDTIVCCLTTIAKKTRKREMACRLWMANEISASIQSFEQVTITVKVNFLMTKMEVMTTFSLSRALHIDANGRTVSFLLVSITIHFSFTFCFFLFLCCPPLSGKFLLMTLLINDFPHSFNCSRW